MLQTNRVTKSHSDDCVPCQCCYCVQMGVVFLQCYLLGLAQAIHHRHPPLCVRVANPYLIIIKCLDWLVLDTRCCLKLRDWLKFESSLVFLLQILIVMYKIKSSVYMTDNCPKIYFFFRFKNKPKT